MSKRFYSGIVLCSGNIMAPFAMEIFILQILGRKSLRALALKNAILLYFTISKSHFIIYTIPFYNTFNIPNFYFSILLIKIIYLHNKIIYIKTQIKTKTQICNHLLPPPPQTTYPNRNPWPRHHPTAKIQTNETHLCHHN